MIDKLLYKGNITKEEHEALISKLKGHDRELKNSVINDLITYDAKKTQKIHTK